MRIAKKTRFDKLFGLQDWDHQLVTSPFVPPWALFATRFTIAVWAFVSGVTDAVYNFVVLDRRPDNYYAFFTRLSFIGLSAYFAAAALQTGAFVRSMKRADRTPHYPLESWHNSLKFLHRLLYASVVTFPIVVTVVYWVLLASEETFRDTYATWSNISFHLLNGVVVLVELILSRVPLRWIYTPFLCLMAGGYIGVAYITHAAQGIYTYSFLNPSQGPVKLALYIIGVGVGFMVVFLISWAISKLRDRFFPDAKGLKDLGVHSIPEVPMSHVV